MRIRLTPSSAASARLRGVTSMSTPITRAAGALLVGDPPPLELEPQPLARRERDPEVEVQRRAGGDGRPSSGLDQLAVVGVDQPFPVRIARDRLRLQPVAPEELGRDSHPVRRHVPVPNPDLRALQRQPQPLLARAKGLLGPLSPGDVPRDDGDPVDLSRVGEDRFDERVEPPPVPVSPRTVRPVSRPPRGRTAPAGGSPRRRASPARCRHRSDPRRAGPGSPHRCR